MKKYSLILCLCFMCLYSFSQNINETKRTHRTFVKQSLQDSTISKTEKVNNVVIQTDSNEIKPSGNNPPSKRSIYNVSRKKFDSISKTISAQSIKLDASDSDKQNNYIKYRANNKKQLLLEVEKQKE